LVDSFVPRFNSLIPSRINIVAILWQPCSVLLAEKLSMNQVVGKKWKVTNDPMISIVCRLAPSLISLKNLSSCSALV
jgi:hypothetical protein